MTAIMHAKLVSDREWIQIRKTAGLSPRQADIVKHIVQGESDKQIARQLNITVPTVRTHLERLFRKFDLNDRVELLVYVFALVRNGWGASPPYEGGADKTPIDKDVDHHGRRAREELGAEQASQLQH